VAGFLLPFNTFYILLAEILMSLSSEGFALLLIYRSTFDCLYDLEIGLFTSVQGQRQE
jgi:hypothetical protein